ncbi:MAG: T9SS type A sorting domain-containing protein [Bacteroidetes bacterium]|jgi:hypothetical protein|nr:T9SS type A sorting domain-containing protein [Bacteroidota bacterium]
MIKSIIISIILIVLHYLNSYCQNWQLEFDDVYAEGWNGYSVALAPDSLILASGMPLYNFGSDDNVGDVRLIYWTGSMWGVGNVPQGTQIYEQSGSSVQFNKDASVLAVGSRLYDHSEWIQSGRVRVFEYDGSSYVQKGSHFYEQTGDYQAGTSVSISAGGDTVAFGGPQDHEGIVGVYAWDGSDWSEVVNPLTGKADGDAFGTAVALSANGKILACGAPYNDNFGTNAGYVKVYKWIGHTYAQMGENIGGEASNDLSGSSVALSADGNTVAIGAPENDGTGTNAGHVRIYHWDGDNWVQKGQDIDGEAAGDHSGFAISMASNGNILAIGANENDGGANNAGHVRVYYWNGVQWEQNGEDLNGQAANDEFGYAVSLSSGGERVAVGAPFNDENGSNAGQVRLFTSCKDLVYISESDCQSYTWPQTGETYTQTGVYSDTLVNNDGCDSIVFLEFTLLSTIDTLNVAACDSFTWSTTGLTYTGTGYYTDTLTNENGCDSILTLNLTINEGYSDTTEITACDSYYWPVNDQTFTTTGVYKDTLTAQNGCDSILTLVLTISDSFTNTIEMTACDSYTWPVNDQTYLNAGYYTETLTNVNGCDSILTLNLTFVELYMDTTEITACYSYTWPVNDETFTISGKYTDTILTQDGCDSIITLDLVIQEIDASVEINNHTLLANEEGADYQWLDCENSYTEIIGQTDRSFTPTSGGTYAVKIVKGKCTDTSACNELEMLSISLFSSFKDQIHVYPNPVNDIVSIELGRMYDEVQLQVIDMNGQIIVDRHYSSVEVIKHSLSDFKKGMYYFKIVSEHYNSAAFKILRE